MAGRPRLSGSSSEGVRCGLPTIPSEILKQSASMSAKPLLSPTVRRKADIQERLGQRSPGDQASKEATADALSQQSLCEELRPNQFLFPCGLPSPSCLGYCE